MKRKKPKNLAHVGPARDVRIFKPLMGNSYRNSRALYPPPPKETWEQLRAEQEQKR